MSNRIVLGDTGGGVYGVKISKPGYDVLSATQDQILLDSTSGVGRALVKGTLYFPAGGTTTVTATIPNMNGTPVVKFAYLYDRGDGVFASPIWWNYGGWTATCTTTSLSVTKTGSTPNDMYISYYCFANNGAS